MEHVLTDLTHSTVTNIPAGRINNADACLLLLRELGGSATTGQLRAGLRAWRPNLEFTYLFNTSDTGGYGFVGGDFLSTHNEVYHQGSDFDNGHTSRRRTYWYRFGRGKYNITAEGIRRLCELGLPLPTEE